MIPARFAHAAFSFVISGIMSCIVTLVATVKAIGLGPQTFGDWMAAWSLSWPIACIIIFLIGPRIRRFVDGLVRSDD
ncbi:MAG: DUF2798 domain-containing protein [Paracoccaceae bacterium]